VIVTGVKLLPPVVLTPDGGLKPLILTGWVCAFGGVLPPVVLTPPVVGRPAPWVMRLNFTVFVQ
jgi:hypothetical protein